MLVSDDGSVVLLSTKTNHVKHAFLYTQSNLQRKLMSSHVHMRMQTRVSICTPVARHHVDMHDEENA